MLPYGLLNELQRAGDAIQILLVEFVGQAIDRIRDGLSSDPESAFFAVALLVPIATYEDRRTDRVVADIARPTARPFG